MESDRAHLSARVRGRVQGVGYRVFVRDRARALGVNGYVRNAEDGSVEVQASGPRPALEALLHVLREGPSHARVEAVDAAWQAATAPGGYGPFEVRA